jgi:hypothetical protein
MFDAIGLSHLLLFPQCLHIFFNLLNCMGNSTMNFRGIVLLHKKSKLVMAFSSTLMSFSVTRPCLNLSFEEIVSNVANRSQYSSQIFAIIVGALQASGWLALRRIC